MKTVGRDCLILLLICAATYGVTRIRLHSRLTERNRGQVVYTTSVKREVALKLMDGLEQVGILNGVPRTYHINRQNGIYQLLVVADPGILKNPQVEPALKAGFSDVCRRAFDGDKASVQLTDIHLTPFRLLLAPQRF